MDLVSATLEIPDEKTVEVKDTRVFVKLKKLPHYDVNWDLPKYESTGAAGADIKAALGHNEKMVIKPGERLLIPTGLSMEIPQGFEIQVRPRSGLSFKTGLMILNSPGTIDSDYRGEVKVIMGNLGKKEEIITHGDRIAQIVLCPVTQATFTDTFDLSETNRGAGGFGSTGMK